VKDTEQLAAEGRHVTVSLEELGRLMALPREHERLEFKEAKNQFDLTRLFRYCVAIANEGGGKLILGVSDQKPRRVVGTQAFLNLNDIQTRILDKLRFRVVVEEIVHAEGRVLAFHIPSRPAGTAYQLEGAYFMRAGEDTVPMTEDQLRAIFDEGKPDWLSELACADLSAADVVRLLDTQSYFDLIKLPYPAARSGVVDRLERDRVIVKQGNSFAVTNFGAILFAKKLQEFEGLSRKAPRVIVYDGTGKLKTRLDQPGAKGYAVGFQGLVDFIIAQTPANEVIEKAIRRETKMFPDIAIRELVANALVHQDFKEVGASVVIEVYSDRIEISNPGKPFIPPERFIDEYQSRNERVADLMRRVGICEEKGSGIDKVVHSAEVYQLPAPDFRVGERRTTVVLFAHKLFQDMDRSDRIRAGYQHCCLRYVMNERMSNVTLRERFKLPEDKSETVSRIIRETTEAGLVKLDNPEIASRRYARYIPFWA
jgi:ATP-dependent DNA helicase RecG